MSLSRARADTNEFFYPRMTMEAGRVLNVGGADGKKAGRGGTYREYFPRALEYLAVDIIAGKGVDLVADAKELPLESESWDAAMCFYVLEHEQEYKRVLGEVHRVLVGGGRLYVAVPSAHARHVSARCNDYWRWTRGALELDLLDAGFRVEISAYAGREVEGERDSRLSYLGAQEERAFEVVLAIARKEQT